MAQKRPELGKFLLLYDKTTQYILSKMENMYIFYSVKGHGLTGEATINKAERIKSDNWSLLFSFLSHFPSFENNNHTDRRPAKLHVG